jgi:RNA polymerase sigma-70 factor (ECF subfamily)
VEQSGTISSRELSNQSGALDEDIALVAATQQGDLDAFERLVARHQKRMLNVSFRLLNDYDEACEVVQDGFLSAHKHIKTFRGEAKFTTWLTTIIVNLSKNRLKQMRSRSGREVFSLDDPVETDDGRLAAGFPSGAPSALDRLEESEVQRGVQECIKTLEQDFREVLVLRDMQDFSYEEIGGILGLREGTVKSRLFRAREAIKECLKHVIGKL